MKFTEADFKELDSFFKHWNFGAFVEVRLLAAIVEIANKKGENHERRTYSTNLINTRSGDRIVLLEGAKNQ